jgi:hypothetical protein
MYAGKRTEKGGAFSLTGTWRMSFDFSLLLLLCQANVSGSLSTMLPKTKVKIRQVL